MVNLNKIIPVNLLFLVLVLFLTQGCAVGQAQTNDYFCSDSDNTFGLDNPKDSYYIKGYSNSNFGAGEDVCKENVLVEYYCENKIRKRISYDCVYGCHEGACIKP